jgi:hypothetical protein
MDLTSTTTLSVVRANRINGKKREIVEPTHPIRCYACTIANIIPSNEVLILP